MTVPIEEALSVPDLPAAFSRAYLRHLLKSR